MSHRLYFAGAIAALAFACPAFAQAPAAPAAMPGVPPNPCAKPDYPGRLASPYRITAFNKESAAYRDCINKYVDATKKLSNDAITAGNAAIDEFNKFGQEVKAQSDANN
jgi:hypothetical protein